MLRRALLLLVLTVGVAAAASPGASAATVSSPHFAATFNDNPDATPPPTATTSQVTAWLGLAEQAYNAYAAMGFPAPATIGGKTNINIVDLAQLHVASIESPGNIDLDAGAVKDADQAPYTIAFAVFAEVAFNYGGLSGWLSQGVASWAAWKSLGYPTASTSQLGPWDMSLDCQFASAVSTTCSADGYANLGLSRWPFYEYLTERFGDAFVSTLLANVQAAAGNGLTGLQTALASKGTDLTTEYGAFTTKLLAGNWTAQQLNLAKLPLTGSPILTGTATGDIPAQTFGVDHLATRFVQIDRGAASAPAHCYAANLTLKVTMPSGITSQPVFYWAQAGSAPVPLALSGTNATVTVPWDTCSWKIHGYLSLPNTTTTSNGALFTVSGHLDVLPAEVTSTPPPTPANGYGTATDVASTQVAPAISFFGPLLLSLPSTATRIELVVAASAEGSLHGTLGAVDLGTRSLVPGVNVIRFALPPAAHETLRASSAVAGVLTLNSVSADGTASGAPIALKVAVEPVKKHTKAKKHKK